MYPNPTSAVVARHNPTASVVTDRHWAEGSSRVRARPPESRLPRLDAEPIQRKPLIGYRGNRPLEDRENRSLEDRDNRSFEDFPLAIIAGRTRMERNRRGWSLFHIDNCCFRVAPREHWQRSKKLLGEFVNDLFGQIVPAHQQSVNSHRFEISRLLGPIARRHQRGVKEWLCPQEFVDDGPGD